MDADRHIDGGARLAGDRLHGVVDEVAEQRDQIVVVEHPARARRLRDLQLDSALSGHRRLGQQQGGKHRVTDAGDDGLGQLLLHGRGLGDQLHRLLAPAQLDQPGDRVQTVRELVRLRPQRVCEPGDADSGRDPRQLGGVAKRGHETQLAVAHRYRPAGGHQGTPAHHHHLVRVVQLPAEESQQTSRRQQLAQLAPDRRVVELEQPFGRVVDQGDAAVAVGGQGAFADALQGRLPLLEQARDLVRLEAEGDPLHPRRQQHGADGAERECDQHRGGIARQLGQEAGADPGFREPDRDHADHLAAPAPDRSLAPRGDAQRPLLDADPGTPGQHRGRVLVHRLADQRRVRVRVPDAAPVGDHHVGGAGRPPDGLGRGLDSVAGIACDQRGLDLVH